MYSYGGFQGTFNVIFHENRRTVPSEKMRIPYKGENELTLRPENYILDEKY
jgi:hypothetical protein